MIFIRENLIIIIFQKFFYSPDLSNIFHFFFEKSHSIRFYRVFKIPLMHDIFLYELVLIAFF